jgi:hypothetical protein
MCLFAVGVGTNYNLHPQSLALHQQHASRGNWHQQTLSRPKCKTQAR